MAETSYPFTASTITQAQWQSMARLFGSTGVAPNIGTELGVFASGGTMGVVVGAGSALVEGFFYDNNAQITFTIAAANATNPRIDTLVLRLNRTTNIVTAVVVAGTPAASPAQPTLNATSALFDFPLADVLVGAAVGLIASGAVTDRRVITGTRGAPVGTTDTQTLTNKTLNSSVLNSSTISGGFVPEIRRGYFVAAVGTIGASSNSGIVQSGVSMTVVAAGRYYWRVSVNYRPTAAGTLTAYTEAIINGNAGTGEVAFQSVSGQTTIVHTGYHDLIAGAVTLGVRFSTGAGTGTYAAENATVEVYQAATIA